MQAPITVSEIIAFQRAYGNSFNIISRAIEDNSYYETAAKNHIDKNYNFKEGKVMFKLGHEDNIPYRDSYEGLLSYLIGKNKKFPNDQGIAKENWRKLEWKNDGIINKNSNVAVIIGNVVMERNDDKRIVQNFTMCLRRDSQGEVKLIAHKITNPCS